MVAVTRSDELRVRDVNPNGRDPRSRVARTPDGFRPPGGRNLPARPGPRPGDAQPNPTSSRMTTRAKSRNRGKCSRGKATESPKWMIQTPARAIQSTERVF